MKTYPYCLSFLMAITNAVLNELKLLKKLRNPINSSFFWSNWILRNSKKINSIFSSYNSCSTMIWKVNVLTATLVKNPSIMLLDMIYQRSKYMCWFTILIWSLKISKSLFFDTYEISKIKVQAIVSMENVFTKCWNIWKKNHANHELFFIN